jgi:hypothetical protein
MIDIFVFTDAITFLRLIFFVPDDEKEEEKEGPPVNGSADEKEDDENPKNTHAAVVTCLLTYKVPKTELVSCDHSGTTKGKGYFR